VTDFKKIFKYQICPVGAELFHADRQTSWSWCGFL